MGQFGFGSKISNQVDLSQINYSLKLILKI